MITLDEFRGGLVKSLPVGRILQNPRRGTTEITGYSERKVSYKRGSSRISVAIGDLFSAYTHFSGGRVNSRDLRRYAPAVFDSSARPAGHSCNCTFLFMVLEQLGLADTISGDGVARRPFYTTFR